MLFISQLLFITFAAAGIGTALLTRGLKSITLKLQTTDLLLIQCCCSNKRIKVLKENKKIAKKGKAIFGKRNRAACVTQKTTQNNKHREKIIQEQITLQSTFLHIYQSS